MREEIILVLAGRKNAIHSHDLVEERVVELGMLEDGRLLIRIF